MAKQSLTDKTIKGVSWSGIDKLANYGIGFVVGIVLARLLSPEDYGLLGIIGIFTSVFNIILDSGLNTALVRKETVSHEDYCTVFYTNLVLSVILTATLFFGAPLIADFFERQELVPLIQVMSFVLIINAFSIVQHARLTKNIDFKTQTKISLISHISSGVIGIIMAYTGFGVWALIAQQLSSKFIRTVLLWIYNKWLPTLIFSWNSFRTLFGFSWKLLVASIISVLSGQLYQGVIGKCYSPATLGQFTRATQYVHLGASTVGDVVLHVSLPVMSSVQNDSERLLRGYRKIIKTTMLVTFLLILGMMACAKELVFVLIGHKWADCIPMMQIICLTWMWYPLHKININMLTVHGRSDIQLILEIIKTVIGFLPLLLGVFVGIFWMLWGSVAVNVIGYFLNSYYSGKKLNYSSWDQLKDIFPSFAIAVVMAIPVYLLSFLPISEFIVLPIQIVVGIAVALTLCELLKREEYLELKKIVIENLGKKFHKTKRNS